ncbi:MAG: SurA N-terminal domain-containing protein [Deltaproteobacteria bacterium]|nr:SurA N-terminal domain-containing protein [Deltaproteobacteria bacterium]
MFKIFKKLLFFGCIFVVFSAILGVGLWFFQERYKKQLWDPGTAAIVNGVPISRKAVEDVFRVGFYPTVTTERSSTGAISMEQILERLIEEELVRQAAHAAGLMVTEEEALAYLEDIKKSWGCVNNPSFRCQLPKGQELDSLMAAIRDRILLNKVIAMVSRTRAKRSQKDFELFLQQWARQNKLPIIYQTRALLAEKKPEVLTILEDPKNRQGGFDTLVAKLKEKALAFVISDNLYLDPRKEAGASLFPEVDLFVTLLDASNDPQKLSTVLSLSESYVVLEVLSVTDNISPEELVRGARLNYESQVSDTAFREYVIELKSRATITVNPNFPGEALNSTPTLTSPLTPFLREPSLEEPPAPPSSP